MTKFSKLSAAPEPELSPTRRTLAEMIEARDAAVAESTVLIERMARLEAAKAEVATINDQLARMNAQEQGAMFAWVSADDGSEAPTPDTTRRQELMVAMAQATAKSNAADGATRSLQSQYDAVNEKIAKIKPSIAVAVGAIVLEELEAALPAMTAAVAEIERCKAFINAGAEFVVIAGNLAPGNMGNPTLKALEGFNVRKLVAGQAVETDTGHINAAWSSLAGRLTADATATLEATS
jgi:hypothetical protein